VYVNECVYVRYMAACQKNNNNLETQNKDELLCSLVHQPASGLGGAHNL